MVISADNRRADARQNTERIRQAYCQVIAELGSVKVFEISRGNLYGRIAHKTGLSTRCISYTLIHLLHC